MKKSSDLLPEARPASPLSDFIKHFYFYKKYKKKEFYLVLTPTTTIDYEPVHQQYHRDFELIHPKNGEIFKFSFHCHADPQCPGCVKSHELIKQKNYTKTTKESIVFTFYEIEKKNSNYSLVVSNYNNKKPQITVMEYDVPYRETVSFDFDDLSQLYEKIKNDKNIYLDGAPLKEGDPQNAVRSVVIKVTQKTEATKNNKTRTCYKHSVEVDENGDLVTILLPEDWEVELAKHKKLTDCYNKISHKDLQIIFSVHEEMLKIKEEDGYKTDAKQNIINNLIKKLEGISNRDFVMDLKKFENKLIKNQEVKANSKESSKSFDDYITKSSTKSSLKAKSSGEIGLKDLRSSVKNDKVIDTSSSNQITDKVVEPEVIVDLSSFEDKSPTKKIDEIRRSRKNKNVGIS